MLIAPIIIVGCKYDLFKSSGTRLTGVGLIVVICVVVFVIKVVKRLLNKLPQEDKKQQTFKFVALMIYSLMLPVGGILLLHLIKTNVSLACDTIMWCLFSFMGGIVIDHLTLKYLEVEWDLRTDAKHQIEVNKRINTLSK